MIKKLLLGTAIATLSLTTLAVGAQAHGSRDRGCWLFDGHHRHAHHVRGWKRHKHVHHRHRKAKVVKAKARKGDTGKAKTTETPKAGKAGDTKAKGDKK